MVLGKSSNDIILKAENISKQYRLGLVGTGTISHDLNRWWHRVHGKEDPYLKIGSVNDRSAKADSDYVWALQDINFEVKRGEVLGIIGKNGAGKSTLLKILSRVTSPTTGEIKTRGRIASLLEVGTGFHPELTGRENIYLNGAILGMTKAEIKTKEDEIVAFSGCERYVDTPVKRYSSGMRVRLAFAVAAFLEPDILVIDEVLAVGDAEFQKKAIGKMQDISKGEGRTVLFVSHNMVAVQNLCSRCILMNNGQIMEDGETHTIIDAYLKVDGGDFDFKRVSEKNKKPYFIDELYITNNKNERIDFLQSGDTFQLNANIMAETPIDDIGLEIGIDGQNGERLVYLSNKIISKRINLNAGKNSICLSSKKFPFLPGIYSVVFNLTETNGRQLDIVQNYFRFKVEAGDFYGTGKLNVNSKGKYLMDYDIFKI